ncbi:MAG: 3D domain-containing protein [Candidatus Woesearchaeota archaeon]
MAEESKLKSLLITIINLIVAPFKEKNMEFEVPLTVALIADLTPFFSFIFGISFLKDLFGSSFIAFFPDYNQIMFMTILFFIAWGYFGVTYSILFFFKFVPIVYIFPIFTTIILTNYLNSIQGEASDAAGKFIGILAGAKKTYPFWAIVFRVIAGIMLCVVVLGNMTNSANVLMGNLPGVIAQPLYEKALPEYQAQVITLRQMLDPRTAYTAAINSIKKTVSYPVTSVKSWFTTQINVATGGYYMGQVDKYANKDLGVYLREVKPTERWFYLDESTYQVPAIQIMASVEGAAIDVDDCEQYLTEAETDFEIKKNQLTAEQEKAYYANILYKNKGDCELNQKVKLGCAISNKRINGTVNPSTISLFEIQNGFAMLECNFDKAKLTKPSSELVDITANFPFVTKSYLKTYFMDLKRFRDMKLQKLDPLTYYKITDTKPIAVYTGGPVMIGIGINDVLPLTLITDIDSPEPIRSYSLGITLDNKWTGKIAELMDIVVVLPPQLELRCPPYFEADPIESNKYILTDFSKKQVIAEKGFKESKTYNCRILPKTILAARELLNNVPLATKYVQVTASYKYEISESTSITLRQGDGIKSDLSSGCTDTSTPCGDYDGCYCTEGCPAGNYLSEVSREYNCNGKYVAIPEAVMTTTSGTGTGTITSGEKPYSWDADTTGLSPVSSITGTTVPNEPSSGFNSAHATEFADGRTYVTSYYTPVRSDFSVWSTFKQTADYKDYMYTDSKGRELLTDAYFTKIGRDNSFRWCVISPKGFYEEVQCQGEGVDNQKKLAYSYATIRIEDETAGATPLSGTGLSYTPRYTLAGPSSLQGREIYLFFGVKSSWNGCYKVQDTGSAIQGNHLDLFRGFSKETHPSQFPKAYLYPGCVAAYEKLKAEQAAAATITQ